MKFPNWLKSLNVNLNVLLAMAMLALFMTDAAMAAARDLNDVARNGEQFIASAKSLMIAVFFLLGLCLFGFGLYSFYKESKEEGRGHAKKGFVMVGVGVALLCIVMIVKLTAATALGSDDNVQDNIQAEQGF